jgi:hypothetical protein
MKKLIQIFVGGVVYTSFLITNVQAQKASHAVFETPPVSTIPVEEPIQFMPGNAVDPIDKTAIKEKKAELKAAKTNLRINNYMAKNFKEISDLKWSTEEKVIIARFSMKEKSARVIYDKRGHWLYSIITYHEDQLPAAVKSLVKNTYEDFDITLVQEISQGNIREIYKVFLESPGRLKQVLVYEGDITVYEDLKKAR